MTRWQRFLCNVMGWHKIGELISFDGCNPAARCARCGYEGMIDSQGNLF